MRPNPTLVRGLIQSWKCVLDQSWSIDSLNNRFDILDDYTIPNDFRKKDLLEKLPERYKPDYKWLLIGGAGSGSKIHIDPCFTSAWNALIHGKKLWLVINPIVGTTFSSFSSSNAQNLFTNSVTKVLLEEPFDGLNFCENCEDKLVRFIREEFMNSISVRSMNRSVAETLIYVFIQKEKEVVYVPAGWHHVVLNLSSTVAITHNFVEKDNLDRFLLEYYRSCGGKFDDIQWDEIKSLMKNEN